jgi:hypothetical protein
MKKRVFLITALLIFISTFSFCLAENSSLNDLANETIIEYVEEDVVIEGLSISIEILEGGSCTVAIEGSIGWNSTYVKVSVSSTAETSEEALSQAWSAFTKAKEMIERL